MQKYIGKDLRYPFFRTHDLKPHSHEIFGLLLLNKKCRHELPKTAKSGHTENGQQSGSQITDL